MSSKRIYRGILTISLSFLLIVGPLMGDVAISASQDGKVSKKAVPLNEEKTYACNGTAIGTVVSELMNGAMGQVSTIAMGLILHLFGWGNENYTDDFNSMNQKLDAIEETLTVIKGEITGLLKGLHIAEAEILVNVEDPKNALNQIYTYDERLREKTKGEKPGAGDKKWIMNFAHEIRDDLIIRQDVNAIYHAIAPISQTDDPILNVYRNLCNLKLVPYNVENDIPKKNLYAAYLGLEKYLSQLIYYQLKGVNLVVEAHNALSQSISGNQSIVSQSYDYVSDFKNTKLNNEIYDPKNGLSFIYNAWYLILSWVDLDQWNSAMFPPKAQEIAERAEFYRRAAVNDVIGKTNLGAVVAVFSTKDIPQMNISLYSGIQRFSPVSVKRYSIPGKVYDQWSGHHVSAGTSYDVYIFDFGSMPPGDYTVLDNDSGDSLGVLTVQNYKADFTPDGKGDYTFGLLAVGRRDASHYEASSPNWHTDTSGKRQNVSSIGGANDRPCGIHGQLDSNDYEYFGDRYLNAWFTYKGDDPQEMTVRYSVDISGYNEAYENAMYGKAQAYTETEISVWDHTRGKFVKEDCSVDKHSSDGEGKKSFNKTLKGDCTFKAEPGHLYFLTIKMRVWCGNTNKDPQKSTVQVDKVNYVRIEF